MEEIKITNDAGNYAQLKNNRAAFSQASAPKIEPVQQIKTQSLMETGEEAELDAAIEQLQELAADHQISLEFSVHKDTGRTVIKVIDPETNKVLRQLPPEAVLEAAANLEELSGALFNSEA